MPAGGNGTIRYRGGGAPAHGLAQALPRWWRRPRLPEPRQILVHLTEPSVKTSGYVIFAAGVLTAACSALPWLDGTTGTSLMFSGKFGGSGNVLFSLMNGLLYLSGIWAILLGLLAALGGLLRARGRESGAALALAAGSLAIIVALLDIVMALTRGAVYHNTPGAGVLLMLALSAVIVTEVLAARFPGDYLLERPPAPGLDDGEPEGRG